MYTKLYVIYNYVYTYYIYIYIYTHTYIRVSVPLRSGGQSAGGPMATRSYHSLRRRGATVLYLVICTYSCIWLLCYIWSLWRRGGLYLHHLVLYSHYLVYVNIIWLYINIICLQVCLNMSRTKRPM